MKETKGERREKKHNKKKHGMRVRGRSVKLLQRLIEEKANGKLAER